MLLSDNTNLDAGTGTLNTVPSTTPLQEEKSKSENNGELLHEKIKINKVFFSDQLNLFSIQDNHDNMKTTSNGEKHNEKRKLGLPKEQNYEDETSLDNITFCEKFSNGESLYDLEGTILPSSKENANFFHDEKKETNDFPTASEIEPFETLINSFQSNSDLYAANKKAKNKKRSTKYDQAFKEMEELDDFESECRNADLKKFEFGSYSFEMISNPSKYSYNAWQSNLNVRLGADGRRLLLRKLRSISSANPKLWQEILQKSNFGDVRNIFTVATVPKLLRIAHSMGPEAWDFALKCACFTYKCPSLSMNDNEHGSDFEDSGNDNNPISSPSKSQSETRTPPRRIKAEKKGIFESPIRTIGSQRKRKSPIKSFSEISNIKIEQNALELPSDPPNEKIRESPDNFIESVNKDDKSLSDETYTTSPRKRKTNLPEKLSSDILPIQNWSTICPKTDLEINEERDFSKYLKRLKAHRNSCKLKSKNNNPKGRSTQVLFYSSSSNHNLHNDAFQSTGAHSSSESFNHFDEDPMIYHKPFYPSSIATKDQSDSKNCSEPLINDFYKANIHSRASCIATQKSLQTIVTTEDQGTKPVVDQCIFIQFLHCITLLDITNKVISSLKGKYSNCTISNHSNIDIGSYINDDDYSKLKLLNENTSNQIENLIKMNDLIYKSHDSVIMSSEILGKGQNISQK